MRRKTHRMPQADLNESALQTPHEFQRLAVQELLDHKWRVSLITEKRAPWPRPTAYVVVMRMVEDSSIGCAIYPNGSFSRSKTSTVKWSWQRAHDAAEATIPDAFVTTILERRKNNVS